MKQKRILVLGYFGYKNHQIDGQTIKTRQIYDLLRERLPEYKHGYVDTQELQTSNMAGAMFEPCPSFLR